MDGYNFCMSFCWIWIDRICSVWYGRLVNVDGRWFRVWTRSRDWGWLWVCVVVWCLSYVLVLSVWVLILERCLYWLCWWCLMKSYYEAVEWRYRRSSVRVRVVFVINLLIVWVGCWCLDWDSIVIVVFFLVLVCVVWWLWLFFLWFEWDELFFVIREFLKSLKRFCLRYW